MELVAYHPFGDLNLEAVPRCLENLLAPGSEYTKFYKDNATWTVNQKFFAFFFNITHI
jgi:hypothetical protein